MAIKKRKTKSGLNLRIPASKPIDYKDTELLEKCIGPQGQIQHRKRTGLSSQRQKELKQALKRARHLALIPFVR